VTIENQTTGDSITVTYPMLLNLNLEIDGEDCEVVYGKVPAHEAITLDDESRAVFIRLAAGSNTLKVTSDNVGTLSVALSWYKRRL
jgi:phage-related protein